MTRATRKLEATISASSWTATRHEFESWNLASGSERRHLAAVNYRGISAARCRRSDHEEVDTAASVVLKGDNPNRTGVFLSAVLALALGAVATAHQMDIVAESGQTLADASGAFEGFSVPQLDDSGNLVFGANLDSRQEGGADSYESIVWIPNTGGVSVLEQGDNAPNDATAASFRHFSLPRLSDDGSIAFRSSVNASSGNAFTVGIWQSNASAPAALAFASGIGESADQDFSGETQSAIAYLGSPEFAEDDSLWFYATLANDLAGIWLKRPSSLNTPTAGVADAITDQGDEVVEAIAFAADPDADSDNDARGWALVSLRGDEEDAVPTRAILRLSLGPAVYEQDAIVKVGDALPGSANPIAHLGRPVRIGQGTVAFWVGVADEAMSEGLYSYSNNALAALIPAGMPISVDDSSIAFDSLGDPVSNATGDLAIIATEKTSAGPLHSLLFKSASSSEWTLLAQTNQGAPGISTGAVFNSFSQPLLSSNGKIAFNATLDGAGDAISDTTNEGIWATDPNGFLSLALRAGDTLSLSGGLASVTELEVADINREGHIAIRCELADGSSAIATTLIETTPPPILDSSLQDAELYEGATLRFSASASGVGPLAYQWYRDEQPIEGANQSELEIPLIGSSHAGEYKVEVRSPYGTAVSATATVTTLPAPAIPFFVEQPVDTSMPRGSDIEISGLAVSSEELSYQWHKYDALIEGATSRILTIPNAEKVDGGRFTLVATSPSGSTASDEITVVVSDGRLVNISTRAFVGTGANSLIAGFAVQGSEPKQVLLRAVGPTLANFDVSNVLAQPKIEIYRDGEVIAANDGWSNYDDQQPLIDATNAVGAFHIPTDSEDAVLLATLEPGIYSTVVSGENETTGTAIVEAYEVAVDRDRFINISSRAFVGVGDDVAIAGFVLEGNQSNTLLIRAVGPSLEKYGVAGVLEFPFIRVFNSDGQVIASNSNWEDNGDLDELLALQAAAGAFPLDSGSEDAALLISMDPGSYTIQVSGEGATQGVSLVEVYEAR